jgi:hypothetical protein
MKDELRDLVKKTFDGKVDTPKTFKGYLGNGYNAVVVPGQSDYVYVTLLDGSVTTAYNVVAPIVLNLPVIIGYDINQSSSKLLKVLSIRDIPRVTNYGEPISLIKVPNHHESHEWLNRNGATDIVYIELRQFMPLRPEPVDPMSVQINRGMLNIGGLWKYIDTQTISVADYVPVFSMSGSSGYYMPPASGSAIQAKFVLISIDSTSGSAVVTDGATMSIWDLRSTDIPATPVGNFPICAVRLYYYQSKIVEASTQTDIIDLRWGMFTDGQSSTGQLPKTVTLPSGFFLTGYDATSGSFSSGSVMSSGSAGIEEAPSDGKQYGRQDAGWTEIVASGSQVVPIHHEAVENYYLTGYDATDGSWTSAEVIAGSSVGYVEEVNSDNEDDRFLRVGGIYPHWEQETETCYSDFFNEGVLTFSNLYPAEIQFFSSQINLDNANHQINTIQKVVRGGFVYRISGTSGLSSGSVVIKIGDYSFPPIVPGSDYYSEAMTAELEAGNHYIIVYASGSATGILENFDLKPAYAYDVLSSGSISIPDAPTDGKLYARASGVWADFDVPKTAVPVNGFYLTGYNAVSGSFTSGSFVKPSTASPVEGYYLTGYDSTSGSFSSGSVLATGASGSHNDLIGLQGGASDEYYHLTETEHTIATQASGSGQDGYLKSEDYNQFKLASAGSGAWYLSDLLDVNIGAQTDGQALVYDSGTDKWIPGSMSSGSGGSSGSGATSLSELSDVLISGSVADQQALLYSSGSGLWIPSDINMGGFFPFGNDTTTTASTSAYASKGNIFKILAKTTIYGISQYFAGTTGYYKPVIAVVNDSNVITSIAYSGTPVAISATGMKCWFPVTPITFEAETRLACIIVRTDTAPTSVCQVPFPSAVPTLPFMEFIGSARYESMNPEVGDSIYYGNTSHIALMSFIMKFSPL